MKEKSKIKRFPRDKRAHNLLSLSVLLLTITLDAKRAAAQDVVDMYTGSQASLPQIIQSRKNFLNNTYFGFIGAGAISTAPNKGGVYIGGGRPWADPRYFGAKGDGITDDTVAIEKAIESALAGSGTLNSTPRRAGLVIIPKGVYKVTRTIEIRKAGLIISGAGLSALEQPGTLEQPYIGTDRAGTTILWAGSGAEPVFKINECWGTSIRDLRIVNLGTTEAERCFAAIQITSSGNDCQFNSIENVRIGYMPGIDYNTPSGTIQPYPDLPARFKYGILIKNDNGSRLSGDTNRFSMILIRGAEVGISVQNSQALYNSWDQIVVGNCDVAFTTDSSAVGRNFGFFKNKVDIVVKDLARLSVQGFYSEYSVKLAKQTNGSYLCLDNGYFLWTGASNGQAFVDISDYDGTLQNGTPYPVGEGLPATTTILEAVKLVASGPSSGINVDDPPYILLASGPVGNQNKVRRNLELNNVLGFSEKNIRNVWGSTNSDATYKDQRYIRGRIAGRQNEATGVTVAWHDASKIAASEFCNILINSGNLLPSQTDPSQQDIDFTRYDRMVSKERTIVLPVFSGSVSGGANPIGVAESHWGTTPAVGGTGPVAPNGSQYLRISSGVNPALSVREGGIWQVK